MAVSASTSTGPLAGTLSAVGVGPGDPELLTLKGARLIRAADVILCPVGGKSAASIARTIVSDLVDLHRQRFETRVFPMTSDRKELEAAWEAVVDEVLDLLRAGQKVVFITLGDPLLFSTFLYVCELLRKRNPDLPIEIVPGVSSINAAAAIAQVPLGMGMETLAVVPATMERDLLRKYLLDFDSIVLLKASPVFAEVRALLTELGLKKKAVYVRRVGLPEEKVWRDLDQVQPVDIDYLSLILVRK